MEFRKDINALRALAVLSVLVFHFNSSWMPGGFAGVDVFFVISGYLMTRIIFEGLEKRSFSLFRFYISRANRIIPALAVLCMVLLIIGWFFLMPKDYLALGKHVVSSLTFISNMVYWTESGYFDVSSHKKWLLHTWSLSVEWQFYLLYPIILILMKGFMSVVAMKRMVLFLAVLGFLFSVIATYTWPTSSYYFLSTRAWEMLVGGVALLYPVNLSQARKKALEAIGLLLILSAFFLISKEDSWPGYLAAIPVVGTFLVILANRRESYILENKFLQCLGKWSYSVYLWHWPFVVIIYSYSLEHFYVFVGIALSIICGFLSFHLVEKRKIQNNYIGFMSLLRCKALYIGAVVSFAGLFIYIQSGFGNSFRLNEQLLKIAAQQEINPRQNECGAVDKNGVSPSCRYGKGEVKAIIVGDSHAQAQIETIGELAERSGGSIIDWGLAGCDTIKGLYRTDINGNVKDERCGKFISNILQDTKEKYSNIPIIIINRWARNLLGRNEDAHLSRPDRFVDKRFSERDDDYRSNITMHTISTICSLAQTNPVFLVRPTPEMKVDIPRSLFNNQILGKEGSIKISVKEFHDRQAIVYSMQNKIRDNCGAVILDPTPYLCDVDYCYGDFGGVPLFFDDNHLSKYGSEIIVKTYEKVFH